jgi:predicted permease
VVNVTSAFVAAQQATLGFAQLPASASRTFIYTGNILNVSILPGFLDQGMGKSAGAHMIWAASAAYKERGFKYVISISILIFFLIFNFSYFGFY